MAVNRRGSINNVAYGIGAPSLTLAPMPIISIRNPTGNDTASLGTLWCNSSANAYFILTSVSAGVSNWEAQSAGTGSFTNVTVSNALAVGGDSTFTGDVTIDGTLTTDGPLDVDSANPVAIRSTSNTVDCVTIQSNGGTTESILIQADQGAGDESIFINSVNGGVAIQSATDLDIATTGGNLNLNGPDEINLGTLYGNNVVTIGNNVGSTEVIINAGVDGIYMPGAPGVVPITIGNATAGSTITLVTPANVPVATLNGISVTGVYVISGTGNPNGTVTAPQGSLYLNTTGNTTSSRAFINSDSGTTWIAITTAS